MKEGMKDFWVIVLWNILILNNVNVFHLFCSFQLNVAQELKLNNNLMLQPNEILYFYVPFLFQLHTLYTEFMLIFILIDVFSFSKGYIDQNYSFSGSRQLITPPPLDTIWKTLFTWSLGITGTLSNMSTIKLGKRTSHW